MSMLSTENRSVSSLTPSPSRENRGLRLFRAISRKLSRKSHEDVTNLNTDTDSNGSSESCNSSRTSRGKKEELSVDSGFRSSSPNNSTTSSESGNSENLTVVRSRHHHSTSAESVRKVFDNLSLNTARSRSCSGATKECCIKRKSNSKKPQPKRILRSPVTYTYVKGLSGLPTKRVPRKQGFYNKGCNCGMQSLGSLER